MSMTAAERRALAWVLAVCVGGAGVQVVRHVGHREAVSAQSGEALARQLLAVDSAQRESRAAGRRATRASRGARGGGARGENGGRGAPRRQARAPEQTAGSRGEAAGERPILTPVDLDTADSAALERLPRIGPALASRIVSDRLQHGAFGSLVALQRVRGIGPKLAAGLAPLVTFSTNGRPSGVRR